MAAQKGQHHSKKPISKEWLVEHYNNRGLSMQACADLQQCSPTTIMKAINKYALPKRKCTERAHAVVRTRIQNDDWPLLLVDRTGNNNPAKRMDVREKIRQSVIALALQGLFPHGIDAVSWEAGFQVPVAPADREKSKRELLAAARIRQQARSLQHLAKSSGQSPGPRPIGQ